MTLCILNNKLPLFTDRNNNLEVGKESSRYFHISKKLQNHISNFWSTWSRKLNIVITCLKVTSCRSHVICKKHQSQSLLFIEKETLVQTFSCEFCEICKNRFYRILFGRLLKSSSAVLLSAIAARANEPASYDLTKLLVTNQGAYRLQASKKTIEKQENTGIKSWEQNNRWTFRH